MSAFLSFSLSASLGLEKASAFMSKLTSVCIRKHTQTVNIHIICSLSQHCRLPCRHTGEQLQNRTLTKLHLKKKEPETGQKQSWEGTIPWRYTGIGVVCACVCACVSVCVCTATRVIVWWLYSNLRALSFSFLFSYSPLPPTYRHTHTCFFSLPLDRWRLCESICAILEKYCITMATQPPVLWRGELQTVQSGFRPTFFPLPRH